MPYIGTITKGRIIDNIAVANGFTRMKTIESVEIMLELINIE
jgi:hypothetical protein